MTNLQALQAMTEYSNDNLLAKVLMDNGVDGTGTYSAGNKQSVDLALADVYLYLATHPKENEGSWAVEWDAARLLAARRDIYNRYGLTPPEDENAVSDRQLIDGTAQW